MRCLRMYNNIMMVANKMDVIVKFHCNSRIARHFNTRDHVFRHHKIILRNSLFKTLKFILLRHETRWWKKFTKRILNFTFTVVYITHRYMYKIYMIDVVRFQSRRLHVIKYDYYITIIYSALFYNYMQKPRSLKICSLG